MLKGKTDMLVIGVWIRRNGKRMRLISYSQHSLKTLRKEFKITQDALAQAVGVAKSTIANHEQGILGNPTNDFLKRMGRYFSSLAGYKIVFYSDWDDSESIDVIVNPHELDS